LGIAVKPNSNAIGFCCGASYNILQSGGQGQLGLATPTRPMPWVWRRS